MLDWAPAIRAIQLRRPGFAIAGYNKAISDLKNRGGKIPIAYWQSVSDAIADRYATEYFDTVVGNEEIISIVGQPYAGGDDEDAEDQPRDSKGRFAGGTGGTKSYKTALGTYVSTTRRKKYLRQRKHTKMRRSKYESAVSSYYNKAGVETGFLGKVLLRHEKVNALIRYKGASVSSSGRWLKNNEFRYYWVKAAFLGTRGGGTDNTITGSYPSYLWAKARKSYGPDNIAIKAQAKGMWVKPAADATNVIDSMFWGWCSEAFSDVMPEISRKFAVRRDTYRGGTFHGRLG